MGVVELDVLDGVEHILAGGRGGVRLAGDGFLHQSGNEQIKVTHHGGPRPGAAARGRSRC